MEESGQVGVKLPPPSRLGRDIRLRQDFGGQGAGQSAVDSGRYTGGSTAASGALALQAEGEAVEAAPRRGTRPTTAKQTVDMTARPRHFGAAQCRLRVALQLDRGGLTAERGGLGLRRARRSAIGI
jgi:hypothetical protein